MFLTEQIYWRELIYGDPVFNAWFFHRHVFEKLGEFDITYKIAGDRDILLRFALSKLAYIPLKKVVYHYRIHNDSLSLTRDLLRFAPMADENLRLVENYQNLVPHSARAYLQRVRTRETITAVSRNLRGGDYNDLARYILLGCRNDFFWPIKFLVRVLTGIFRAAGRKLGIYPPI
jgi:hypothetical protein